MNQHHCDPKCKHWYIIMVHQLLHHSVHSYTCTGTVNNAGDTPLSLACANGHLDTVKYLVNQHHCDPKSKHWYIIMIHQLLHHSVHSYTCTGTVNNAGDTPLSLACANGHLDTVKYLVNQHHCDPKCKHWYIIMVHQLLHHSVHSYTCTGTVNNAGDTPLSLACANGHLDTVKYLVNQHHCDPKSKHWYIHNYRTLIAASLSTLVYMYRYSQQGR